MATNPLVTTEVGTFEVLLCNGVQALVSTPGNGTVQVRDKQYTASVRLDLTKDGWTVREERYPSVPVRHAGMANYGKTVAPTVEAKVLTAAKAALLQHLEQAPDALYEAAREHADKNTRDATAKVAKATAELAQARKELAEAVKDAAWVNRAHGR